MKGRKRQGWDIHNGYLLYLIGGSDDTIARLLKISKAAVQRRRRTRWELGRA